MKGSWEGLGFGSDSGKRGGQKNMARRKLTFDEQLKGVRAALRSKRTPPQLRPGLERRKETLERFLNKTARDERSKPGLRSKRLYTL